jgi:hypothetical protein
VRDDSLGALPWRLLGIHSTRMDIGNRDTVQDETLGLNGAWYADIILTLTGTQPPSNRSEMGPRHRIA